MQKTCERGSKEAAFHKTVAVVELSLCRWPIAGKPESLHGGDDATQNREQWPEGLPIGKKGNRLVLVSMHPFT